MAEGTGRRPSSRCGGSRRAGVVVALLSLPALVAGCTGAAEPASGPTAPTTEETPVPSEPPEPGSGDRASSTTGHPMPAPAVVTEEHAGRTFSLPRGVEVSVRLDSAWAWGEPSVEGSAVTVTRVDHFVDPGFAEWLVTGSAPGTARLTIIGDPNCADPAACPPRTVELGFQVP